MSGKIKTFTIKPRWGRKMPEVFVETGTFRGDTTDSASAIFKKVITIELDDKLYNEAVDKFRDKTNVVCIHGDSESVLATILPEIKEPVFFYLDAHFSGEGTAFGDEEVPLLKELEIIGKRYYDDIIIIDDVRLFDKTGKCGNGREWPFMTYDWRGITEKECIESLTRKVSKKKVRNDELVLWL